MIVKELNIKGVYEIQLMPFEDDRGYFARTYDSDIFKKHGIDRGWVQENHSLSLRKGTVRGLHFQYPPDTETKVMRAVTGEIFFAFVDLRKGSPTFGKWGSLVISDKNKKLLYMSRGCALGMCTLTDNCNLSYKVDNCYASKNEDVLLWNDPDIGIVWPVREPSIISKRDCNGKTFKEFVERCGGLVL
ncbi:dTDP-4-dehydrorhamnose 3,5-epimerase [Candidatus Woesearchaeota archaeon]|nr:dTDP-4-dehydrorhamnose 3,5-epimerase [Candidatus Woesearchaeota archaeon]